MIDIYSDDEEYLVVRMHGVMKSMYHQMLIATKFESDKIDQHDPVWHITYRKRDFRLSAYQDKVIDTVKRFCTYEKFGLTYHDLMAMDIPTFDRFRELIIQTDNALGASNQAIADNIEKSLKH